MRSSYRRVGLGFGLVSCEFCVSFLLGPFSGNLSPVFYITSHPDQRSLAIRPYIGDISVLSALFHVIGAVDKTSFLVF